MIPDVVAQTDWVEVLKNGNLFRIAFEPYINLVSREGVVLLLGLPFTMALWIQTRSISVPSVLLVLFASLMIGGAPPAASMVGYLLVVAAIIIGYRTILGDGGPV